MGLIKCIDCGKEISDRIDNCPNCGCPVEVSKKELDSVSKIEQESVKQPQRMEYKTSIVKKNNIVPEPVNEIKNNNKPKDPTSPYKECIRCGARIMKSQMTCTQCGSRQDVAYTSESFNNTKRKSKRNIAVEVGEIFFCVMVVGIVLSIKVSMSLFWIPFFASFLSYNLFVNGLPENSKARSALYRFGMPFVLVMVFLLVSILFIPKNDEDRASNVDETEVVAEQTPNINANTNTNTNSNQPSDTNDTTTFLNTTNSNTLSEEEYKALCQYLPHNDILRNPGNYDGVYCAVTGRIDQALEGWFNTWTLYIVDSSGNKWGCTYTYSDGESRMLEGDWVTLYGKCYGTQSVDTVLGDQVTLPYVDVEYR